MNVKSKNFDGEPRASAEYKYDQKNPAFRREVKKMREAGWSRPAARACAREMCRKPSANPNAS